MKNRIYNNLKKSQKKDNDKNFFKSFQKNKCS